MAGQVPAQTLDLVSHNGFEQCWSSAITLEAFVQRLAVDTREICLPPAADGSSCVGSLCSDGTPGCSVTMRDGSYEPVVLQPADPGMARFDGSFGFEPFSMPVEVPTVGSCLLTFIDTADVRIRQSIHYGLRPDGNSGYHLFHGSVGYSDVVGLTSQDVSLTGSFLCQLSSFGVSFFIDVLTSQLASTFADVVIAETAGHSLCPLP